MMILSAFSWLVEISGRGMTHPLVISTGSPSPVISRVCSWLKLSMKSLSVCNSSHIMLISWFLFSVTVRTTFYAERIVAVVRWCIIPVPLDVLVAPLMLYSWYLSNARNTSDQCDIWTSQCSVAFCQMLAIMGSTSRHFHQWLLHLHSLELSWLTTVVLCWFSTQIWLMLSLILHYL